MEPIEYLKLTSDESQQVHRTMVEESALILIAAARELGECVRRGGKVLLFGNGGSAADAQHMAAEMVGRMLVDRRPLPALALTTDSSNLTALSNDFGYDQVFKKQIEALARKEDAVIAISTSGNSKNVIEAVLSARKIGCKVIALSGGNGGELCKLADYPICARLGKNSSRIQESHSFAIHTLVDLLDRYFLS